jgi:hypothetical protein
VSDYTLSTTEALLFVERLRQEIFQGNMCLIRRQDGEMVMRPMLRTTKKAEEPKPLRPLPQPVAENQIDSV